jgi:hypothetical protein
MTKPYTLAVEQWLFVSSESKNHHPMVTLHLYCTLPVIISVHYSLELQLKQSKTWLYKAFHLPFLVLIDGNWSYLCGPNIIACYRQSEYWTMMVNILSRVRTQRNTENIWKECSLEMRVENTSNMGNNTRQWCWRMCLKLNIVRCKHEIQRYDWKIQPKWPIFTLWHTHLNPSRWIRHLVSKIWYNPCLPPQPPPPPNIIRFPYVLTD